MTTNRVLASIGVCVVAAALLTVVHAQGTGAGGGQRGGGAGRVEAGPPAPGILLSGVWGADPYPVDARGWGWMTKSYVGASYKRPFYNKAKEMLFSGQQVTSYTISSFDPQLYCEVRKH